MEKERKAPFIELFKWEKPGQSNIEKTSDILFAAYIFHKVYRGRRGVMRRNPAVNVDSWFGPWKIFYPKGTGMPLGICPMVMGKNAMHASVITSSEDATIRKDLRGKSDQLE